MDNHKIPERKDANPHYFWNLTHLYENDSLWQEEYDAVCNFLPQLTAYEGKLLKGGQSLLECLETNDIISQRIDKLYVYATMKFHEDSTNSYYQNLSSKAEMLLVKYSTSCAFMVPEILEIPPQKLEQFVLQTPSLSLYQHVLDNISRMRSHTLSQKEEALLAKTNDISGAAQNIFTMINDADMVFDDITVDGEKVQLTKGRYVTFLENSNRPIRKEAFETFYKSYSRQKNTLATTYYESVKNDVFQAEVRNYPSALNMALADDKIPPSVYTTLLETVNRHLPLLHRYVELRKKLLNVDELHMYDLYAPLVKDVDWKIPYEKAKSMVKEGLSCLGKDYLDALQEGFDGGWIDVYENKGKRSGAYSWGTYSAHPYVLLNYNDTINSAFTLAHEMGHALHSYYTWNVQPYVYSGHKIFVAEVASTVNEALFMQHLLKTTTNHKIRLYLLNYFMEQFRGTFFRQTMFAEFEKITHELVEQGEPLSCTKLNEIYHALNRQYFGPNIIIDSPIDIEWARIPHFYNAFYVYQYATGYSAAITLSRKILKEGESAVKAYQEFLAKGNSEYSIDLLKGAGVDMTTAKPLETAMSVFEEILTQMEKETAK